MGRRVIAITIALVVALLGAVGVVSYAQAADKRAVAGQQPESVYITKAEVPMGTTAQEAVALKLIVQQQVVARGVPEGALQTIGATNGALVATSAIMPGEIVLASRFGTLAAQVQSKAIPDGKVAVTVELADPNRIAPLLTPGSHIVIYDTFNPRDPKSKDPVPNGARLTDNAAGMRTTKVLMDDVEVIAVGATTVVPAPKATAPADGEAKQAEVVSKALVTVAVTPEQAVKLIHAIQTGELYAALRGGDVKVDPRIFSNDDTVLKR